MNTNLKKVKILIFISLFFFSCATQKKNINSVLNNNRNDTVFNYHKINYQEIKKYDLTGFGDCIKYNKEVNGVVITMKFHNENGKLVISPAKDFYGKVYLKDSCEEIVRNKHTQELLNGYYMITKLPNLGYDLINISGIDFVIAEFINGKRTGNWYYYPPNSNINMGKQLFKNEHYVSPPVKIERYKNGKPDGKWILYDKGKTYYFIYQEGKLIKEYQE